VIFENICININHAFFYSLLLLAPFLFCYSIIFLIISLSLFPSSSNFLMPADNKSVAILLLLSSCLKIDSLISTYSISRFLAFSASNFLRTSSCPEFNSSKSFGEIVSLSQPANYFTSPVLLNEAPITIVS
jgi:hypothetical protein